MKKLYDSIAEIISDNYYFFILYSLFLAIGAAWLLIFEKGQLVRMLGEYHGSFLDGVFIFFTNIGEGTYFAFFLLIAGFFSVRYLIFGLFSFLGAGAVVQIMKYFIDAPRPKEFFWNVNDLSFVEGIEVYSWNSMPSGHTATGFVIFLFFALLIVNMRLGVLFFIFAFLVAFSRVYLVQHFFVDIYVGSIIGTLSALFFYHVFFKTEFSKKSKFLNYSLKSKLFKSKMPDSIT